jgi:hypothetical protein
MGKFDDRVDKVILNDQKVIDAILADINRMIEGANKNKTVLSMPIYNDPQGNPTSVVEVLKYYKSFWKHAKKDCNINSSNK